MRIGTRHWLLAFAGALLLHVGIAAWVLWQAPESGAVSTGLGGIEVALGPTGGAPGSSVPLDADVPEAEVATALEEASTPQPATVPEVRPDPVPDVTVETVEAVDSPVPETPFEPEPSEVSVEPETVVQVEAVESPMPETPLEPELPEVDAEPEPIVPVEPVDALPTDAEIAVAAVPVEMPPEVAARPVVIPPRPPRKPQRTRAVEPEVAEPLPQPPAPVEQANAAQDAAQDATQEQESDLPAAPPRGPVVSDRVTAAAPGADGRSGLEDSANAGSGSAASAGGSPGALSDYNALLLAWLQKHKEYPRRAKLRQQQGTAMLYILLDREGRVLEHRIEETSGYALLDREVLALVERAQPLPRMPDEMTNARLELIVPVEFFLR